MATWKSQTHEQIADGVRAENPRWDPREIEASADAKVLISPNNLRDFDQPHTPWRDVARRIVCPVMLMTADPDRGGIVTPEIAAEALAFWPQGQLVHIHGAGHNIHRDQFAPFLEAVRTFFCTYAR